MIASAIRKLLTPKPAVHFKWQPAHRPYVKDKALEETLYTKGYAIAAQLDADTLQALRNVYTSTHHFNVPGGGMFYSLYSRDVPYRKKVHAELEELLAPLYNSLFENYRSVLNSFIVKVSGPESEFCLHQDSTRIDEVKYSNLSVWIPLRDTDMSNGCLCVVPYSHRMFGPYRGISFAPLFEKIESTVRKYLTPLPMKAGQVLLFDNRLVHNSGINQSGADRCVIMAGIYPKEAPIVSCYKDEADPNSPIELIEQTDDYLITYENFLHDCRCRPETGTHAAFVNWELKPTSEAEFLAMCEHFKIQRTNITELLVAAEIQKGLDTPVTS